MNNKVSIIIPVYNKEKYIRTCLESVINQTYQNLEIIVIDDASTDSSLQIVKSFQDERIKIITLSENQGVSTARNKGIDVSTGDYICFIDADDFWVKEKLQKQLDFIQTNDYEFVFSDYYFYSDKKQKVLRKTNVPASLDYEEALKNTTIFVSTVMFNMKKLKKEEIYMPNIKIAQDTATWWKVLKKGIKAYAIKEVLAYYRVYKESVSSNKLKAVIGAWKSYKEEDIKFIKKLYCFSCYGLNAIKRRI